MFSYNLRLSVTSLLKDKFLTSLMVLAVALGIGLSMTILTVYHMLSADPIPEKSSYLHLVRLDAWNPLEPFEEPNVAPNQLTYRDVIAMQRSDIPTRHAAMFKTGFVLQPDNENIKPYLVTARATDSDFFAMFNVPYLYGGSWGRDADSSSTQVVVINRETNDKLFGGKDSVGEMILLDDYYFKIVGVLDTWQPSILYYDTNNGNFDEPADLFIPFSLTPALELDSWGNTNGWKGETIDTYEDRLNSEYVWIQYWAELDDGDRVADYQAFIDGYAMEQKKLGRFARPLNNQLTPLMDYLKEVEVVGEETLVLLALAFMFLSVCLLNVIGLILAKFSGKSTEISIRRALGADKMTLFTQHIIESGVIGVAGGILGLVFALAGLAGISLLVPDIAKVASMDFSLMGYTMFLSIVCTILAGVYPTWQVCQIQPASYLKEQ
jgi:putative ABC transport system permease protein